MRLPVRAYLRQKKTSLINNANVLAMGERVVSYGMGAEMAEKWLDGNGAMALQRREEGITSGDMRGC